MNFFKDCFGRGRVRAAVERADLLCRLRRAEQRVPALERKVRNLHKTRLDLERSTRCWRTSAFEALGLVGRLYQRLDGPCGNDELAEELADELRALITAIYSPAEARAIHRAAVRSRLNKGAL